MVTDWRCISIKEWWIFHCHVSAHVSLPEDKFQGPQSKKKGIHPCLGVTSLEWQKSPLVFFVGCFFLKGFKQLGALHPKGFPTIFPMKMSTDWVFPVSSKRDVSFIKITFGTVVVFVLACFFHKYLFRKKSTKKSQCFFHPAIFLDHQASLFFTKSEWFKKWKEKQYHRFSSPTTPVLLKVSQQRYRSQIKTFTPSDVDPAPKTETFFDIHAVGCWPCATTRSVRLIPSKISSRPYNFHSKKNKMLNLNSDPVGFLERKGWGELLLGGCLFCFLRKKVDFSEN